MVAEPVQPLHSTTVSLEQMETAVASDLDIKKMIYKLSGPVENIPQSVPNENGYEVWRLLNKKYNLLTTMRGLQIVLKVLPRPPSLLSTHTHTSDQTTRRKKDANC